VRLNPITGSKALSSSPRTLLARWGLIAALLSSVVSTCHASDGAALHHKSCASCHNGMFPGGDGEMIYSAEFRKIKQLTQLRQRVETCASRVNAGWFDEEIDGVTQWLNQRFYRFQSGK
jgi:mono/diheme cytochrome c family protein